MSTRDRLIAVRSAEALRAVVGSQDGKLYEAILASAVERLEDEYGPRDELDEDELEEFQEQLAETRAQLTHMLSTEPPVDEPGCWAFLIPEVIERRQMDVPVRFEFNKGYKHISAWDPYRKLLDSRISEAGRQALRFLDDGRPLRGERIDYDGCLFGWLSQAEIAVLHDSLSVIPTTEVGDSDLEEFHQDLINALAELMVHQCDLVLIAH